MKGARAVLYVGVLLLCAALGVLIEEKLDGDDVGALSVAVAIGGGALAGYGSYLAALEKKKREEEC